MVVYVIIKARYVCRFIIFEGSHIQERESNMKRMDKKRDVEIVILLNVSIMMMIRR